MRVVRIGAVILLVLLVMLLLWKMWPKPEPKLELEAEVDRRSYDVVVLGSDPEAVAAAVAAARAGQTTLLLDRKSVLGGVITRAALNTLDMSYDPGQKRLLTQGIFKEFFEMNDRRTSLDLEDARLALEKLAAGEKKRLDVALAAERIRPVRSGRQVTGVSFRYNGRSSSVTGKAFIDATPDADFAYDAGAAFTFGQEDYRGVREPMSATQVFELEGVDWKAVVGALMRDDDPSTGADSHSAWGFTAMRDYPSRDPELRLRAPNLGRQANGTVLVNALQILNVDGTDPASVERARRQAETELPHVVDYMRRFPGFADARLAGMAEELYIRETRHMKGLYRLTIDDVMENRDFADKIAFGSYPVDIQKTRHFDDMIIGNPDQYSIPFRSLVPEELDNLLVSSRSASYDSLAHGSARTIPVGMAVSEAAGVAAAYANESGIDFHAIAQDPEYRHIRQIQERLQAAGNPLDPIPRYPDSLSVQWSYPAVKFLRHYALIAAGYDNDYHYATPMSRKEFYTLFTQARELAGIDSPVSLAPEWGRDESTLTLADVSPFFGTVQLPPVLIGQLVRPVITRDTGYMLIYELLHGEQG